MLYPQCQYVNPDGARFCNACGARLEAVCPACSQTNPLGSHFCNACGHNLAHQPSPAPVASPGSPQDYTPQHLAEQLLAILRGVEAELLSPEVVGRDYGSRTGA